jgi:universal stress protein family protein
MLDAVTRSGPVVLCFDGSEDARRAIEEAGRLLAPRPAVVLTVWEAARDLTVLDPVGDAVGRFEPRTRVECGPVWRTIVAAAAYEDAATIVVGARGLSRAAAALGSVSARVSRHAGRPVLVVPPAGEQAAEPGAQPAA